MKSQCLTLTAVLVAAAVPHTVVGFQTSSSSSSKVSFLPLLSMASTGIQEEEEGVDDFPQRQPKEQKTTMSKAIPFLSCPKVLQDSDLAGNVGFDPLELAKSKEQLWQYREAEIKHSRLAMLAAVGWPVSEVLDRAIAEYFQAPTMLDDGDRAPSVINGGLGKIPVQFWGFCLGLCAAIDMYGVAKARRGDDDYFPGNLGFDPLNLYPRDREGQKRMELAEIKHGRTAMVGVLGYVLEESKTRLAVVDETPFFFQPLTETVEEAMESAITAEEAIAGAIGGTGEAMQAAGAFGGL
eukprot:scaffold22672_cov141-Cylindrotheca_fusiformis.AAC.2